MIHLVRLGQGMLGLGAIVFIVGAFIGLLLGIDWGIHHQPWWTGGIFAVILFIGLSYWVGVAIERVDAESRPRRND